MSGTWILGWIMRKRDTLVVYREDLQVQVLLSQFLVSTNSASYKSHPAHKLGTSMLTSTIDLILNKSN